MPYGLPNETPAMTRKMERCVAELTKQGKSKQSAIAICKATIMKKKFGKMKIVNFVEFAEPKGKTSSIEILKAGEWDHPSYGRMKITERVIDGMIKNFDDDLRKGVYITEGHPTAGEELPAVGWVKNLIKQGSDRLVAVVEWTEAGTKLIKSKAYKFFSPEFYFTYEDAETREEHKNVLTGGALTNAPYFKSLEAVALSEKILINNKQTSMKLSEILKKKPSELTDKEKKFLSENREHLDANTIKLFKLDEFDKEQEEKEGETEEEKAKREAEEKAKAEEEAKKKEEEEKEGEEEEEGEGEEEETEEKEEKVEASEVKTMKEQLNKYEMKEQLRSVKDGMAKLVFTESNEGGVILKSEEKDVTKFAMSLTNDQRNQFFSIMGKVPKANVFGEIGSGKFKNEVKTPKGVDKESFDLAEKAKEIQASEKKADGSVYSLDEATILADERIQSEK